jgi:hypothetical protein
MKDAESNREREIERRARELHAASVAGLDGHTRSRLSRARAAAVAAAGERRRIPWLTPAGFLPARLLAAGGVAAALIAVALVWQIPEAPVATATPVVINDLDLLLEGENLDFFEELEFYAWLLEQPDLLEVDASGDDKG